MQSVQSFKKVPNDVEAEKALLGAVFLKPDVISDILEIVKASDFYRVSYKLIFEAMVEAYSNDEVIDPVIVVSRLKKKSKFEEAGGDKIILDILNDVTTAANATSYANIVREKSILRRLGEVGTQIVEMSSEGYEEVDTILDKAEGLIFKISETNESKDIVSLKDVIVKEFERLEKVSQNKGVATGIPSGFQNYDAITSGFHPSDLVILAARPAMGKTAFALNIALNAALKAGKSVLVFSLEMGNEQLLQRLMAIESGVPLQKIKNAFLQTEDWAKLGRASGKLAESNILIADTPSVNVLEIRAIARRLKAAGNLDMIFIDYLQLIKGSSSKGQNREQEISEISRSLKGIARELNIPIVALSQLSRQVENRPDKRPMLSDLRESGAIEQDADQVMFLYRDDYYDEESPLKGITEVIIGKHRSGPTGTAHLKFFGELTKFADYTDKVE